MNLKQAAGRLGVHYQTAYKWVRSGELAAIRVGGRYEVSEAAIEQLTARRAAARYEPAMESDPSPIETDGDDVLEQLEAMALDPFVSRRGVASFAARRGAELLGDLCLVTCFDDQGQLEFVEVGHPDPAHGAVIANAVDQVGHPLTELGLVFTDDRPILMPHVPQDLLRRQLRPELLQHLPFNPVLSLLSVPLGWTGHRCGALSFARTRLHRPYTGDDEEFAVRMAERIGPLFRSADDVTRALAELRRLRVALVALVAEQPADSVANATVQQLVDDGPRDQELPLGVVDPQLRWIAVNDAVGAIKGTSTEDLIGADYLDDQMTPEDRERNLVGFAELASGELDYATINGRRLLPDGREFVYQSHRAAIRRDDASLAFVICIARPLRLPEADYDSVALAAFPPIAVHAPGSAAANR